MSGLVQIVISSIIGSFGGATVVLLGLSGFLGKVWANRIREIDRGAVEDRLRRLESRLERTNHVHRAQFEAEFKALRVIWRRCAIVRSTIVTVRPSGNRAPQDETPEQRMARFQQARQRFSEARAELVAALDHNSAFIDDSVYSIVDALRNRATQENNDLGGHQPFTSDWYDEGDAGIRDVMALTEAVSTVIRTRLRSLVITE